MWETIQHAMTSTGKTVRFLVIMAGLLCLVVLACHALGPTTPEVLRAVTAAVHTGA
jgi:hypothetical protein